MSLLDRYQFLIKPGVCHNYRGSIGFYLAAMILCASAMQSATAQDLLPSPQQKYQLALEAESAREYPMMLHYLRQAAKEGDTNAQENLIFVLLTGPSVYGNAIVANRCEAMYWARKAMVSGNKAVRAQLDFLNRNRTSPDGVDVCANNKLGQK